MTTLYRFDETKTRTAAGTQQRAHVEPSQAPVDEVLFSTMEDAPAKEVEAFKQPFPCMNEPLYNRITEAIQTDELEQVEKVSDTSLTTEGYDDLVPMVPCWKGVQRYRPSP